MSSVSPNVFNGGYVEEQTVLIDDDVPAPDFCDDCQDMSVSDGSVERIGNNRYHEPKYKARAKRKAAKASQRRNRK